jgi:hypothetical protein
MLEESVSGVQGNRKPARSSQARSPDFKVQKLAIISGKRTRRGHLSLIERVQAIRVRPVLRFAAFVATHPIGQDLVFESNTPEHFLAR